MQQLSSLIGRGVLVLALLATAVASYEVRAARASNFSNKVAVAPISTKSGAAEIALAEHLTKVGAKMYGAHWCSHCNRQKQAFGATAWPKVTYVECAQGGANYDPKACQKAGIKAYPTWEINGKQYLGTMSLFRLAKISGYTGSTAFQNTRAVS
jgi:hypothetical protein